MDLASNQVESKQTANKQSKQTKQTKAENTASPKHATSTPACHRSRLPA
jgi:hypothetical protein